MERFNEVAFTFNGTIALIHFLSLFYALCSWSFFVTSLINVPKSEKSDIKTQIVKSSILLILPNALLTYWYSGQNDKLKLKTHLLFEKKMTMCYISD